MSDTEEKLSDQNDNDRLFVVDTTCRHGADRTHEMIVNGIPTQFTFKQGVPLSVPRQVALRFLQTPSFMHTDEHGEKKDFEPVPKEPGQMEAGQMFALGVDQTVARYKELTIDALLVRAALLPGGEGIKKAMGKDKVIDFIIKAKREAAAANVASDQEPDGFTPEFDD